ncbi:hypothetical protein [Streptomyces sp. NPDC004270]
MHAAARDQSGTEEIPEATVEARRLFEALVGEQPADPVRLSTVQRAVASELLTAALPDGPDDAEAVALGL